ncbi:hypothetical protein [Subtercola boreus]|uniref:hypothetical protein n=1 Tax=Subtercola boreus TaxID=120213 RepID=UPI0011C06050|nr:hypothetical protein [Subtercola boreus]
MPHLETAGADAGDRSSLLKAVETTARPATVIAPVGPEYTRTVHHSGNRFFATAEMAEIFSAQAERTVQSGQTELIPLLHSSGVELLLVSPQTVFAVVTIEVGRPKVL